MKKNVVETSRKKSCVKAQLENMVVQNRNMCGNCIYYQYSDNGGGYCQSRKRNTKSGDYCSDHSPIKK